MGNVLTPVFFWDINIEIGEVVSASQEQFFRFGDGHYKLAQIGPGRLEQYEEPDHFLYTFTDGNWFEFLEKEPT